MANRRKAQRRAVRSKPSQIPEIVAGQGRPGRECGSVAVSVMRQSRNLKVQGQLGEGMSMGTDNEAKVILGPQLFHAPLDVGDVR